MKRKTVKLLAILLCVVMTATISSCKNNKSETANSKNRLPAGEVTYPIKTNAKLTYWVSLDAKAAASAKNLGYTEFAKELKKQTGIDVEWIHPALGQENENFNIMASSKNLPDIIERGFLNYPGGPDKAIEDHIILKLNGLIDRYAPNYKKYLMSEPDLGKQVKTDSGTLYGFPFVRGTDMNCVFYGPIMRGDWLNDLNLEIPTTIDEYENVLKAFKDKEGATAAFTQIGTEDNFITGAFGISKGWYIDDNKKVAYGPARPEFKDYLTVMNRWYREGILDKNFASNDEDAVKSNMLSGKSGLILGYSGGYLATLMNIMKDKDSKYELVGAPYPTLKKGEKVKFANKDWKFNTVTAAITPNCKNPELAMRLLDYGYSKKGNLLYNFGIEGVSFKMVNGYPTLTDNVIKNPDKLSVAEAIAKYSRGSYVGPFVQSKELDEQFTMGMPQQKQAKKLWAQADPYPNKYPLATFNSKESQEIVGIEAPLNAYANENIIKFIMGTEPLSDFDKFQAQLKKLNIDRAIEIRQASVDRYNKR
ncbi:MAG: extracellular solute-binding protein [Clostridiales bacterium]|nr:extracellular solute-binding protein [Clostridiales bacterium]